MEKRISRMLTKQSDIDYFVNLKEEDITTSFIMETFGEFKEKRKYNVWDKIIIPKGAYGNEEYSNDKEFLTTVGIWVFNKYYIEKELISLLGYINRTIDKKYMGKLNSQLSLAVLEKDISLDNMKKFLMKTQKTMPYISILSPHQSLKILTLADIVEPKKKELLKKYGERLKQGDALASDEMEKELLAYAKDAIKNDEGYDWIDSGARASFGNNIKNMYIMKGAIRDPITNEFNIATSCYANGMSKEEYKYFANSLAAGPYSRARKTSGGGYNEKLMVAGYQHVHLLPRGSDCKTKHYLEVDFSTESIKDYIYSYIVEGDKLVEINSKNMSKYDGKKVKIRFASLCEAKDGYCSKCVGDLLYKLNEGNPSGIENIGMVMSLPASTLKNVAMKAFHNSTVSYYTIKPELFFFD